FGLLALLLSAPLVMSWISVSLWIVSLLVLGCRSFVLLALNSLPPSILALLLPLLTRLTRTLPLLWFFLATLLVKLCGLLNRSCSAPAWSLTLLRKSLGSL